MTGVWVPSGCLLFSLLLFPFDVASLAACEVPAGLLTGRSLSESRPIVEGEVVFVADALLHDFEGRTSAISGRVIARGLEDAVGCITIEADSLDTGIRRRNEIMWKDHLEVARFPEILFILTGLADVQKKGDGARVILEGEVVLHGVSRSLRIPASVSARNEMFQVEGETKLKMSEHAIERPSFLFFTVGDDVEVRFTVVVGGAHDGDH